MTHTRHHQHMTWSNTGRRSDRYGRDHRTTRAAHMAALTAAGTGRCAERVCIKRSRLITPDMPLHLCHDNRTGAVLGLGHAACNLSEAARRANRLSRRRRAPRQSALRW